MTCCETALPLHRWPNAASPRALRSVLRNPTAMTVVAAVLILCQVADGVMTAMGLSRFGVGMEGNPALRASMVALGVVPALILAKACAIGIVIWLRLIGDRVAWVGEALAILSLLYVSAALIPWGYMLLA